MTVSAAIRSLAVDPAHHLPVGPGVELVPLEGATLWVDKWPVAQIVHFDGAGPVDVAATVAAARAAARARGKAILGWWVPPEHDPFVPALEACGLVNEDAGGFESVEHAMALVEAPRRPADPAIDVRAVETWEDFAAAQHVAQRAFGTPEVAEQDLRERFDEYREGPGLAFVAFLDGRPVGSADLLFGDAGVNLFGGAVVEDARGRGVYTALVHERWRLAMERGTPALTVQAGRLSRPILERLGFQLVAPVRLYFDAI